MDTADALPTSRNHRLYSISTCMLICIVYAALLFYAAYILYTGAEKMKVYFNGWINAAYDELKFCVRQ